jgi:hypothetical protein
VVGGQHDVVEVEHAAVGQGAQMPGRATSRPTITSRRTGEAGNKRSQEQTLNSA